MFILVIMSFSVSQNILLGSDGEPIDLAKITYLLSSNNFPAMKGKPKLVIVQSSAEGENYKVYEFKAYAFY